MNILVLGASGQLGSEIYEQLSLINNYNIFAPKKNKLDLLEKDFVFKLNKNLDFIINCSAIHDLDFAQQNLDLTYQLNSFVPKVLAEYCENTGCHLIHFSTDYVFDGFKINNKEYTEEDFTNPINIYGASKVSGENFIKSIFDKYYIFRVSSLFGKKPPSGKKFNFVDAIVHKYKNNENISVVVDQISKPTSTLYIAKIIKETICNKFSPGLYHLTNDQSLSYYDYALKIIKYFDKRFLVNKIYYKNLNFKVMRPKFSSLSSSKINLLKKTNDELDKYLAQYLKHKQYI